MKPLEYYRPELHQHLANPTPRDPHARVLYRALQQMPGLQSTQILSAIAELLNSSAERAYLKGLRDGFKDGYRWSADAAGVALDPAVHGLLEAL